MVLNERNFIFEKVFPSGMELSVGRLFQIAELSVTCGGTVAEHKQICDEITYVVSGGATVYSDGAAEHLSAGQVHFIAKDSVHAIVADEEEHFRYICIGYLLSETEELSEFFALCRQKKAFVAEDDSTIKKLSELMLSEFYGWDRQTDSMVSRYLVQILVSLHRLMTGKSKQQKDIETVSAGMTVYRVARFIDREFAEIRHVKEVADTLCYNECYISHLFREQTGMTVKEYLMRRKMEESARLLTDTAQSVEKISESVGFPTAHTFRRAFKAYMGASPTDYRKTAKNGR